MANHHGDRSNEPQERCRGQHEAQVDDVQRRAAQAVVRDDVGRRGPDRRRWGNCNHHSHHQRTGEQAPRCRFEPARSQPTLPATRIDTLDAQTDRQFGLTLAALRVLPVQFPSYRSDWRCAEKTAQVLGCEELRDWHCAGNCAEEAVCLRLVVPQRAEHVLHLRRGRLQSCQIAGHLKQRRGLLVTLCLTHGQRCIQRLAAR